MVPQASVRRRTPGPSGPRCTPSTPRRLIRQNSAGLRPAHTTRRKAQGSPRHRLTATRGTTPRAWVAWRPWTAARSRDTGSSAPHPWRPSQRRLACPRRAGPCRSRPSWPLRRPRRLGLRSPDEPATTPAPTAPKSALPRRPRCPVTGRAWSAVRGSAIPFRFVETRFLMICPDSAGDTSPAVSRTRHASPAPRGAMRNVLSCALPCVVLLALAGPARAQGQTTPDSRPVSGTVAGPGIRPDPADPAVPVPRAMHRSALSGSAPVAADTPPIPWRSANETVNRIGGWRAYAREASMPPAPAPSPAAAEGGPTQGGARPEPSMHRDRHHHGHHGHQGHQGHQGQHGPRP